MLFQVVLPIFICTRVARSGRALQNLRGGDYGHCPLDNAVCVVVRMRPPQASGARRHHRGDALADTEGKCDRCVMLTGSDDMWPFDVIFPYDPVENTVPGNDEVVETVVAPSVAQAFACEDKEKQCQSTAMFAYGATGSGKSYTMGFETNGNGIMQAAVTQVFDKLAELGSRGHVLGKHSVWMSFYEVYGTNSRSTGVFDMLKDRAALGGGGQNFILGLLTYKKVDSFNHFSTVLADALQLRSVGATGMNELTCPILRLTRARRRKGPALWPPPLPRSPSP